jgi:hypothetical protein
MNAGKPAALRAAEADPNRAALVKGRHDMPTLTTQPVRDAMQHGQNPPVPKPWRTARSAWSRCIFIQPNVPSVASFGA